jgi:YebC/PmpR family DNA-binding regulatory protein
MTDSRNRAASEIRSLLEKGGGNMGSSGCVSYMFSKKGSLVFEKNTVDEEKLTLDAIDAGAEDILSEESTIEVVTGPETFEKVKQALKAKGFTPSSAEVTMVPSTTVKLTGDDAHKIVKLVKSLEDHDDVQNVHANFDVPDDILEQES